jgi:hypothetical protein
MEAHVTRDELIGWLKGNMKAFQTYDELADKIIAAGLVTVTGPWKPQEGVLAMMNNENSRFEVRLSGLVGDRWLVQSKRNGVVHFARPDQLSPIGD